MHKVTLQPINVLVVCATKKLTACHCMLQAKKGKDGRTDGQSASFSYRVAAIAIAIAVSAGMLASCCALYCLVFSLSLTVASSLL